MHTKTCKKLWLNRLTFVRPFSTRYFQTSDNNYDIIITIIVIIVIIIIIFVVSSSSNSKSNSSKIVITIILKETLVKNKISGKWYISEGFTVKGSALIKSKMYWHLWDSII